jgi:hypothetical protein
MEKIIKTVIKSRSQSEVVSSSEMDALDAASEQERLGYHPVGYGGPSGFRCVAVPDFGDGKTQYQAIWSCGGSCD